MKCSKICYNNVKKNFEINKGGKTMTRKFISIALALCLVLSCFTALGVTAFAAENGKAKTGGQTISIDVSNCDTPDSPTSWYIWTWPDGGEGRLVSGILMIAITMLLS